MKIHPGAEPQTDAENNEKAPESPVSAAWCDTLQSGGMGCTGLEPVTSTMSKNLTVRRKSLFFP